MDNNSNDKGRLIQLVDLSKRFCELCQTAEEYDKTEFTDHSLDLLPRIYWNFFDLQASVVSLGGFDYFSSYVDEEFYEDIRRRISIVMGADDTYLDTFIEDMQYSDTPISATISEGMADIFQSLFNFVNIVKDSEGEQLEEAFINCKEEFENYWSQTLCNLLKVFNNIKYGNHLNDDEL
ncbi:MAG: DUF5063 domain-containing protein [Muribaculaceae bacterium]|nr:DUF5063 domain-containing protein [Muribaculaceae bacterium]